MIFNGMLIQKGRDILWWQRLCLTYPGGLFAWENWHIISALVNNQEAQAVLA